MQHPSCSVTWRETMRGRITLANVEDGDLRRPLMEAHAHAVCAGQGNVLNVGFGLGLVDEVRAYLSLSVWQQAHSLLEVEVAHVQACAIHARPAAVPVKRDFILKDSSEHTRREMGFLWVVAGHPAAPAAVAHHCGSAP